MADGGLPLRLGFAGPLEWDTMLGYLAARAIAGVEQVDGGVYRRTVLVDGDPGVIEVARGGADHLVLDGAPSPLGRSHPPVVQQVRRLFNLDFDLDRAVRCSDATR